MDLEVLLPEQLQRHAVALELAVDVGALRPGPVADRGGAAEQPAIQRRVVQLVRQRPAQPTLRRPLQIVIDRPHPDRARLGHRLVGQSLLMSEPQYLANLPHLQPPCRHPLTSTLRRVLSNPEMSLKRGTRSSLPDNRIDGSKQVLAQAALRAARD